MPGSVVSRPFIGREMHHSSQPWLHILCSAAPRKGPSCATREGKRHVSKGTTPQPGAVAHDAKGTCLMFAEQWSTELNRILSPRQNAPLNIAARCRHSDRGSRGGVGAVSFIRPSRLGIPAGSAGVMNGPHSRPRAPRGEAIPAVVLVLLLAPHGTHSFVEEGCLW